MQPINNNFITEYLKKFKVFKNGVLVNPDWKMLRDKRCPVCSNKLKFPLYKDIVYCSSKKHKVRFVITRKRYDDIINK